MTNILEEKENKSILEDLVHTYHIGQIYIAIEELSELQKELCKFLRAIQNLKAHTFSQINIVEEMADVYIMLEQIKIYFDISQEKKKMIVYFTLDTLILKA